MPAPASGGGAERCRSVIDASIVFGFSLCCRQFFLGPVGIWFHSGKSCANAHHDMPKDARYLRDRSTAQHQNSSPGLVAVDRSRLLNCYSHSVMSIERTAAAARFSGRPAALQLSMRLSQACSSLAERCHNMAEEGVRFLPRLPSQLAASFAWKAQRFATSL